jgi:hypothetical protein
VGPPGQERDPRPRRDADIDLGLRLAPDLQAANEWQLTTGGGMVTAGIHTGLTGRPVDHLVIDDPLKDRDEADSPSIRENVWEFWTGTAVPRLAPGAPVTLVMTRWHHDDLAGRLMKEMPGRWRVVHIPAQADPEIVDPDPLDRAPGAYMISARGRTDDDWERRKSEMGADWQPLAKAPRPRPAANTSTSPGSATGGGTATGPRSPPTGHGSCGPTPTGSSPSTWRSARSEDRGLDRRVLLGDPHRREPRAPGRRPQAGPRTPADRRRPAPSSTGGGPKRSTSRPAPGPRSWSGRR